MQADDAKVKANDGRQVASIKEKQATPFVVLRDVLLLIRPVVVPWNLIKALLSNRVSSKKLI